MTAERAKYQGGYVPEDIAGLFNDVGCVEAATYFAQREMQSVSALSAFDLHTVMTSETASVNDPFLTRERDNLLGRVRPGRPHTADLRRAVEQCFTFAEAVQNERRGLSLDPNLNTPKRRDALGRYINSDLYQPLASALHPVQKVKAEVDRGRAEAGRAGPDRDVVELGQDLAAVEAALYFAKRGLEGATDVSPYDLDAMLTGSGA